MSKQATKGAPEESEYNLGMMAVFFGSEDLTSCRSLSVSDVYLELSAYHNASLSACGN